MLPLVTLAAALLTPAQAEAPPQKPDTLGATNYRVDEPMRRPANARLVWRDEFAAPTLDTAAWRYETQRNQAGWANNERQYYSANRPENVRIENGVLTIEARADGASVATLPDYGKQDYTSGRLSTSGKKVWTYGFFEIRAKLPCGRGLWPAIWMMPEADVPWPTGGEIDIMEQVGWRPHVIHGTLHTELFTHTKGTQRGAERPLATDCSAFHRYQLDWRPNAITVGIDGRAFMRVRNDQPGGRGAWPFDAPFHMILNLAVGGDWGGAKGIDPAALPGKLQIDYVRVWQAPRGR
jgi:beta-glucanase (GH16 family)